METSFHEILYLRQVYPPTMFERRKRYGVPVMQCQNVIVREYVSKVLGVLGDELGMVCTRTPLRVVLKVSLDSSRRVTSTKSSL